jgi:hypothetical protein
VGVEEEGEGSKSEVADDVVKHSILTSLAYSIPPLIPPNKLSHSKQELQNGLKEISLQKVKFNE